MNKNLKYQFTAKNNFFFEIFWKILLLVLTKQNGVIIVTEKLFLLDIQWHTKNNSRIIKDLEKNQHQTKKKIHHPKRCEKE